MINPLDCPRCNARPEPGYPYTPVEIVGVGVRMLWQDFLNGLRRSWREAHRNTYDDCTHPPLMRDHSDPDLFMYYLERCKVCGRTKHRDDRREFPEWLTDEERLKARRW